MDQFAPEPPAGAWPPGLTRVPYWVYRDPEIAREEQSRVFEGAGLAFPVPGDRRAGNGRLSHHDDGRDAGGGGPRRRRRSRRLREPVCPSRFADLPGRRRQREGLPVRLSRLALRSARQPDLDRVPPRASTARAGCRTTSRWRRTVRASCARRSCAAWCSARWRGRTRHRDLYRAGGAGAPAPGAAQETRGDRPVHATVAVQLEALHGERARHLSCKSVAHVFHDLPHHPAEPGRRRDGQRERCRACQHDAGGGEGTG